MRCLKFFSFAITYTLVGLTSRQFTTITMAGKRKRDETAELRVSSVTTAPSAIVGSFFNGFDAPKDAKLDVYQTKSGKETLFHGENSRLDYNGIPSEDQDSEYAIALYDPLNKSVDLYKVPVLLGSVTSKSHRKLKGPAIKTTGVRMNVMRNALGEAFGTKKAKKAITDLERNRIDADRLVDSQADIIDTVRSGTTNLPTREQLNETVLNDRPTPFCNPDATNVADIYPVESIISSEELNAIRVGPIMNEMELSGKLELLPYQESPYIKKHIERYTDESHTEKLQLLYVVSLLMGLYHNRRISNKQALATELNNPSDVLIDGLLERFAISKAGQFGRHKDRSYKIDPHGEDRLLCYLLCAIMHIDNFTVEISPLAQELSLKPSRLIGLFKALGCNVKPVSAAEAEAYEIPRAAAASYKIATLKVPFKMPQMTRRGRKA